VRRTLVLCVSWKGPIQEVSRAIAELEKAGASKLIHTGVTDVALARNLGLRLALDALSWSDQLAQHDTLLLLDDDVEVTPENAQALVDWSRKLAAPVSGAYGTTTGVVAAGLIGPDAKPPWMVGAGFLAVPVAMLRKLAGRLPELSHANKRFKPFCCSGIHPAAPDTWTSEDYWLCRELGGVHLAPVPARHWKTLPIDVPGATLAKISALFEGTQ
jgi:hypothetical protein